MSSEGVIAKNSSQVSYNSELEDLFSPRKADQECKCSFCRPAIDQRWAVETRQEVTRVQKKSNIYDKIPPLISIALETNEDLQSVPLVWSPAAELAERNERSGEEIVRSSKDEKDNNTHTSKLAQTRVKQITCSCSFCAKSFSTTRALELHVRRHSGLRPYPCKFCDKCFYQPSERAVHMRTHTGARPYRCPHCLKLFRYSGDLKQHINIHTGQRPYQCEICAKAFTNHSTLRQHRRIHTGERPYRCEECDKTYRYHSSLKQHLSAHASKLNQQARG